MAGTSPDLIVRVAANISALQTDMAVASKSVEATTASWQDFTKGFDVESTINHPLDTAKGALAALAGEMGPTAVAALATAGAFAAVGAAVFELATRAAEVGGHLNDMSEKTGMSVPALSRLSQAAQVAGSDLGTMTSALFMFEKNLGEDTPKFAKGLDRIGLSIAEVKATGVDNWLALVAHHMAETEDPSQRAAAAMELFGRQGREIIPTLLKLDEALEKTADIRPWTDQQAKDAEQFEMQLSSLKVHAEALAIAAGEPLIGPISAFVGGLLSAGSAINDYVDLSGGLVTLLGNLRQGYLWAASASDLYHGSVGALPPVTGDASLGVKKLEDAVKAYTQSGQAAAITVTDEARAIRDLTADRKVDEDAVRKFVATVKAGMEDEKKAQIEYSDLETRLHLIALGHQKEQTAEQKKELDARNKEVVAGNAQILALGGQLHDLEMKGSMDTATYQIMKIWEKAEQEIKAFKGTEQQAATHADLVRTLASYEAQGITDSMTAAVDTMVGKAVFALDEVAAKVKAAAAITYTGGHHMSQLELDAYYQTPSGIAEIVRNGGKRYYEGELTPRALGGPVSAGNPYLVGERGPELFVPQSSGSVVANGAGGAPTVNIYVTQPLGTPDAISRVVLQALQAAARNQGIRL